MPALIPDYSGGSLVNLAAELERRLTGDAPMPGLHPAIGTLIPTAATYVLVLFDGLGSRQLGHPAAASLRADHRADLDAPFPTTTTVSLASVATGLPPAGHGLLGYQLWMPELGAVANTIKWTTLWGDALDYPYDEFLPSPNLWERLRAAGREPITVQPMHFADTPLSRLLYRGARFEGVATETDIVDATVQMAAAPGRLVFVYVPHVDFAAHVVGQDDPGYAAALDTAGMVWEGIRRRLPPGAVVVGTADHGHVDFPPDRRNTIPRDEHTDRIFYGDGRVMFVKGDGAPLAGSLPARWAPISELGPWWGPEPRHPEFSARAPDGALVADDGWLLLHRFSDKRLVGNHGGLTDEERMVPLLVGP